MSDQPDQKPPERDPPLLAERDLEALLDLSNSLIKTRDVEGSLHEMCGRVAQVMKVDRCTIFLLDDQAHHGFVVAASDDPSVTHHRIEISAYPEIAEVMRTGEPLVIDDVGRAPLLDAVRDKIRDKSIASITLFPVRLEQRVQGVMMLRERTIRARSLTPGELRFGRIVANATAIAIRNARLYERIRDTSERRLSERLQAEKRLRQIEKYQRFFDFAGDGLMIIDDGARILFANRAARAILGFDAAALSRITLHDIVEPKGREALHVLVDGIGHGRYQSYLDLPVIRASGESAILSLTTAALEESAQSGEAIISFRDVTATRKMEEELRTTKDFLLNLIESTADAIVAADMKGRIVIFNQVAERITGHRAAEMIGKSVTMLYPPGLAREIMADLRSPAHGGVGKLQDRRQSLLTHTGELVPINLAAAIVYDQGREVATVGIFSDLRERLQIEEQLKKAQHQLELSERQAAVMELAGAAAHELNQPLTSIMGSAELMLRKITPESPTSATMKTIVTEAERAAEIVRKLGQITKYQTKPYLGITKIVDIDAASKEEE